MNRLKSVKFNRLYRSRASIHKKEYFQIFILLLLSSLWSAHISAQDLTSLRTLSFDATTDTLQLDSLIIEASSFQLFYHDSTKVNDSDYYLDPIHAHFVWKAPLPENKLTATYRVLAINLKQPFRRRSTDIIQPEDEYYINPYTFRPQVTQESVFGSTKLNKTGSISRGIGFGNNQDLTVNSTLSLQLNGQLTDNINVLASVTDNNIPIQPDGNTAQLQEFDQVYIQLYNDKSKLIMGDFVLENPTGYFTNYFKRAQGGSFSSNVPIAKSSDVNFFTQTSVALSKGKFARNIIQGQEGNQGPYRLRGNEGENFIIILSGTEKVYIDGRELKRGQENDYVIDYNTAEVTFTAKQFIDKDKRITVEFQYSDANYVRSMIQTSTGVENEKFKAYINFYSEQDAKNQSLQQDLDDDAKMILNDVGDNIRDAVAPNYSAVDQFTNDQVLYQLTDSLGYDSVFVRATANVPNLYRVNFSEVGVENGDYIQNGFDATGRIFLWVAPDTVAGQIVKQGNYAPLRLLVAPQKSQILMAGGTYKFSEHTDAMVELGFTNNDVNTFSDKDKGNNYSHGINAKLNHAQPLSDKENPTSIVGRINMESIGNNFQPIEPYRSVEFNRNWNLNPEFNLNHQNIISGMVGIVKPQKYDFNYTLNKFTAGKDYDGLKNELHARADFEGFEALFDGSILQTSGFEKSTFTRHKSVIEKRVWITKVGFQDEREENRRYLSKTDSLSASAYKFYDWQFYLTNPDTSKLGYKVFYRERNDFISQSDDLDQSTHARQYGLDLSLVENPSNQFKATISNRELKVIDTELTDQEPESTLLGRLEHNLRLAKNAIISNTYYEIGSGLERRQEFIYLQDPTGQGPYTWIDYNEDGIKDLNEFEMARPEDGDRYIRVFTPTDTYERAYSNQFSQSLNINPVALWINKEGFLKVLARFSNQTAFRIQRKTRMEEGADRFNPFLTSFGDSALISQSSSIRNTFFFNRSSSKFGVDYTLSNQFSKNPLTTGFEERKNVSHILRVRYNFSSKYGVVLDQEIGEKESFSDIIDGRNYRIDYFNLKQTLTFQPGTSFRIGFTNIYSQKLNAKSLGGEEAKIIDLGLDFRLSKVESGTMFAQVNVISISYTGDANNSISYQMLDGLQDGTNVTWGAGIQRNLGANLQLSLSYNGRKSEEVKSVHTGNMQVRAFF